MHHFVLGVLGAMEEGSSSSAACPHVVVLTTRTPQNYSEFNNITYVRDEPLHLSAASLSVPVVDMALPKAMLGARRSEYVAALRIFNLTCPWMPILLTDGTDTFLRCNASTLRQRILSHSSAQRVLVSAETHYSFQSKHRQRWYEVLAAEHAKRWNRNASSVKKKYLNCGGIAGRVADVLPFMQAANDTEGPKPTMSWFTPWHDQAPVSDAFYKLAAQSPEHVGLDYESEIFYVAAKEEHQPTDLMAQVGLHDSCLVHIPGSSHDPKVAKKLRLVWNAVHSSLKSATSADSADGASILQAAAVEAERVAVADIVWRMRREKKARGLIKT